MNTVMFYSRCLREGKTRLQGRGGSKRGGRERRREERERKEEIGGGEGRGGRRGGGGEGKGRKLVLQAAVVLCAMPQPLPPWLNFLI